MNTRAIVLQYLVLPLVVVGVLVVAVVVVAILVVVVGEVDDVVVVEMVVVVIIVVEVFLFACSTNKDLLNLHVTVRHTVMMELTLAIWIDGLIWLQEVIDLM